MSPIYTYESDDGELIEREYPFGKAPKTYKGMKRKIDVGTIIYKGPGWTKNSHSM